MAKERCTFLFGDCLRSISRRCEVRDPHVGYIKAGIFISMHPDVK
jgi:hypothetical protein